MMITLIIAGRISAFCTTPAGNNSNGLLTSPIPTHWKRHGCALRLCESMEPRVLDQTGGGGGVGMRPGGGQGVRPPAGRPLRGQAGKQQHPWRFGQADNIWVRIDPLEPMVTMVLIHCTGIISLVGLGAH